MDQDLNELTLFFEGKTPSVSMFKRKLVLEPYEIQHAYLDHFFDLALHTWDIVRPVVQNFYECLVKSFRQEFLDYLSTLFYVLLGYVGLFLSYMKEVNLPVFPYTIRNTKAALPAPALPRGSP